MGLETGDLFSSLNEAWPLPGDQRSEGDDHIRLLKHVLRYTFSDTVSTLTITNKTAVKINAQTSITYSGAAPAIPANSRTALTLAGEISFVGGYTFGWNTYYDTVATSFKAISAGWGGFLNQNSSTGLLSIGRSSASVAAGAAMSMTNVLTFDPTLGATFADGRVNYAYAGQINLQTLGTYNVNWIKAGGNGYGWYKSSDGTLTGTTPTSLMVLNDAGALTVLGSITSGGNVQSYGVFASTVASCVLGTTGAGTVLLRPNGAGSATGQTTIDSTGLMTVNGALTTTGITVQGTSAQIYLRDTDAGADNFFIHVNNDTFYVLTDRDDNSVYEAPHPLALVNSSATGQLYGNTIWTTANDGAGSGLDADTVDGIQGSSLARTDVRPAFVTGGTGNNGIATAASSLGEVEFRGNGTGAAMINFHRPASFAAYFGIDTDNVWKVGGWSMGAVSYKIWHEGNDGAGSGLDADTVDGLQLSAAGAANTVAARDVSGDIVARLLRTEYAAGGWTGAYILGLNANGGAGTDNYARPVAAATAGASLNAAVPTGGLGNSALFKGPASVVNAGVDVAGSSLLYANAYGTTSSAPAGTWRCMGYQGSNNQERITLYLRVA